MNVLGYKCDHSMSTRHQSTGLGTRLIRISLTLTSRLNMLSTVWSIVGGTMTLAKLCEW